MSAKSQSVAWKPLTISTATVLQGGCSKEPIVLDVQDVYEDSALEEQCRFVEVAKTKQWVYKAALGPLAQRGSIHESKCIHDLRHKLEVALGAKEPVSAVADATPPPKPGNADPMAQLALLSAEKTPQPDRKSHHKKHRKRPADEIAVVMAPERFGSENTRPVKMFRGQRGKVFVELDAVPWLITFVREEVMCAGCVGIVSDPHGLQDSLSSNCDSAVAEMYKTRWDPAREMWTSIWLDGPRKGQDVSVPLRSFTKDKYEKVRQTCADVPPWEQASKADKKAAALELLEKHMSNTLQEILGEQQDEA